MVERDIFWACARRNSKRVHNCIHHGVDWGRSTLDGSGDCISAMHVQFLGT
jgi:hypothetical protein